MKARFALHISRSMHAGSVAFKHRSVMLPVRNGGSVMLVALVFLIMLSLGATLGMRSSTMELRMAGNDETRVRTFELAQALLDTVVNSPANFTVSEPVGHKNCTANIVGCDRVNVILGPALLAQFSGDQARVIVERMAPAWSPPPRGSDSSVEAFRQARFEVQASYGDAEGGSGRVSLVQGVSILVPHGTQRN